MFAIWTLLYGLYRVSKSTKKPNLWIIFIWGSFYGLIIEFLQFLVPTNRNPEALDLVADMLGAMAAIFLLRYLFQSITKNRSDLTT